MGYPSIQEASRFRKCLDQFGSSSGLEANAQKSQFFSFNTPSITRRNIIRILGFSEGFLPATFLGTPLINTQSRKRSWIELVDKVKKHLSNWTLKSLNPPSHLVLVKSVLQALPTYMFSTMLVPKYILRDLRNVHRSFCGVVLRIIINGLWLIGTVSANLNLKGV